MALSSLHGLNVVHSPPPSTNQDSDSLLNAPPYSDLSAQLDLWTHLAFDNDEPHEKYLTDKGKDNSSVGDDIDEDDVPEGPAPHDGHDNVVTGKTASIGSTAAPSVTNASVPQPSQPSFDLTNFLAGFGIDGLLAPQIPQSQQTNIVPSLAQLLAPHSPAFQHHQSPHTLQQSSASTYVTQSLQDDLPSKRARTRKLSASNMERTTDFDRDETPGPNSSTPLTAAEDKRRRNTAASARFRLKKKEREAALEKKAKELELRVNELERECEGLRRENGWLKGLVVGVTGAGAAPNQTSVAAGNKRNRDKIENA